MVKIYVLCSCSVLLLLSLSCSAEYYIGDDLGYSDSALATLQKVERRNLRPRRKCQSWRRKCVPWSSEARTSCCGGLACKCNLWMQNCKCTTKLWG
ncbi:U8-agatoxin-Ao1a-like [Pecten maximus]|uniref:U8-agatoxin-Ao1a-like n=1 Tax=Pecten maximus TaxID=6579 RepID=UPI0014587F13|nr:U8-agatoxin-Ao1a-like [Pecten maximus]